jgi:hypothetical protein
MCEIRVLLFCLRGRRDEEMKEKEMGTSCSLPPLFILALLADRQQRIHIHLELGHIARRGFDAVGSVDPSPTPWTPW